MKKNFFKINGSKLSVIHLESIRTIFYQIAGIGFIVFIGMLLLHTISCIVKQNPPTTILNVFTDIFTVFIGIIIPIAALFVASRFPPAPHVTFNSNSQKVIWRNQKEILHIPFKDVSFSTKRYLSKSGISSVAVTILAISDKPFTNEQQLGNDLNKLWGVSISLAYSVSQQSPCT